MSNKKSAPQKVCVWFADESKVTEPLLESIQRKFEHKLKVKKLTGDKGRPDLAGSIAIFPTWTGNRFFFDVFMGKIKEFKRAELDLKKI
jgi:hypothetical protein